MMVGDERLSVRFVLEHHLGHRTYAENLRAAAEARDDVVAEWVPVEYRLPDWVDHLPGAVQRVTGSLAGRREVRSGLRESTSDVDVYNTQVPAALAGRRLCRPYVAVTDVTPSQYDAIAMGYGHAADRDGPLARWKHRVNQRVFTGAGFCVGWSSWAAASFTEDYGVPAERTRVIAPGVDLDVWCPCDRAATDDADDLVRLLFVGGELERKGGDTLLDVFGSLPTNSELTLVTRAAVPATERVRVVNDLEPNDPRLIELYRTSDVFVLPTRAETFGIAAVEASACGLPVVATRVGGLTDIVVDGETGLLLEPGDGRALAAGLGQLVRDASLRRRLGAAARAHASTSFDGAVNAGRLLDLARSLVP